jgi:hypothetical protein
MLLSLVVFYVGRTREAVRRKQFLISYGALPKASAPYACYAALSRSVQRPEGAALTAELGNGLINTGKFIMKIGD